MSDTFTDLVKSVTYDAGRARSTLNATEENFYTSISLLVVVTMNAKVL